jgi:hypothetical protein
MKSIPSKNHNMEAHMAKNEVKTTKVGKVPILGSILREPDSYRTSNGKTTGYGSTPEKSQKDFERKSKKR